MAKGARRSGKRVRRPAGGRKAAPAHAARPGFLLKVPIALKFAIAMALTVILFLVWQGYRYLSEEVLNQQAAVNRSGIRLVCYIARTVEPFWVRFEPLGDRPSTDPEYARLLQTLQDALASYHRDPGSEGILDIVVHDPTQGLASAAGAKRYSFPPDHAALAIESEEARAAQVEIREGTFTSFRSGGATLARSFRKDVISGGQPVGRVELFLDAARIEQARQRRWRSMATITLSGAVLAGIVSFLLGAYLARPIRSLVRDMRVVSTGDLGHRSSIRRADEMGDLARAFNYMTENLTLAAEARAAEKAREQEMALAAQIQANLLPREVPRIPGYDIAACYEAAKEVSGDYYDIIPIDQRRIGLFVADAVGKGVPGSLIMAMTRSLVRLAAQRNPSPRETLVRVHRILARDLEAGRFVSGIYVALDPAERRITVARAGHSPLLYYRARSRSVASVAPGGIAIGMGGDEGLFAQRLQEGKVDLEPGDIFLLYTDGITEAMDPSGREYGEARLRAVIARNAAAGSQEIVQAILKDLEAHRGGVDRSDDVTFITVKVGA